MVNDATYKETFESEYRIFIEAVSILAQSAKKQCELMGNYNVAWELKDDVSCASDLLSNPATTFTPEQKYIIQQLIDDLHRIPKSVLHEATTEEENLMAMKHSCWDSLRKHAAIVLRALE